MVGLGLIEDELLDGELWPVVGEEDVEARAAVAADPCHQLHRVRPSAGPVDRLLEAAGHVGSAAGGGQPSLDGEAVELVEILDQHRLVAITNRQLQGQDTHNTDGVNGSFGPDPSPPRGLSTAPSQAESTATPRPATCISQLSGAQLRTRWCPPIRRRLVGPLTCRTPQAGEGGGLRGA